MHFIFDCPLYNEIRDRYITQILSGTREEQLYSLMNIFVRQTAKYIKYAFKKRSQILYC